MINKKIHDEEIREWNSYRNLYARGGISGMIETEKIKKAAKREDLILDLKFVLWDLVNETRAYPKAAIDMMPYINRIRKVFKKK